MAMPRAFRSEVLCILGFLLYSSFHLLFSLAEKTPVTKSMIKVTDGFLDPEFADPVVLYQAGEFDWCNLPGYKLTLTFDSVDTLPSAVVFMKDLKLRKSVGCQTLSMQSGAISAQYTLESCDIWKYLDGSLCPKTLFILAWGLSDPHIKTTLLVERVTQAEKQMTSDNQWQTFPVKTSIGIDLKFPMLKTCTYPDTGRFYWIAPSAYPGHSPQCVQQFYNPGALNAIYFNDVTSTRDGDNTTGYVRCDVTQDDGDAQLSPPTWEAEKQLYLSEAYTKNYFDSDTIVYDTKGFDWCSLPGYKLTLTFHNTDAIKLVFLSLKKDAGKRPGKNTVAMHRGTLIDHYAVESCELWKFMKDLTFCPEELSITVTGLTDNNFCAKLSLQRVRMASQEPDDGMGNKYPVHNAPAGINLALHSKHTKCTYPSSGTFYWVTAPLNNKTPPQCFMRSESQGLIHATYFHDVRESGVDEGMKQYVYCKAVVVQENKPSVAPPSTPSVTPWSNSSPDNHVAKTPSIPPWSPQTKQWGNEVSVSVTPRQSVAPAVAHEMRSHWEDIPITPPYWEDTTSNTTVVYDVSDFEWCTLPGYALFFTFREKVATKKVSVFFSLKGSSEEPSKQLKMPMQRAPSAAYYTGDSCQFWTIINGMASCPKVFSVKVTGLHSLNIHASLTVRRVEMASKQDTFPNKNFLSLRRFPVGIETLCSNPTMCTSTGTGRFYWIAPPSEKSPVPQCFHRYRTTGVIRAVYFQDFIKEDLVISRYLQTHFSSSLVSWGNHHVHPQDSYEDKEIPNMTTLTPTVHLTETLKHVTAVPRSPRPLTSFVGVPPATNENQTITAHTPETILQSAVEVTHVSTVGQTNIYTYSLQFLVGKSYIKGSAGPYVLSFCFQRFAHLPTVVKHTIGTSTIILTQGLSARDSEICYRVNSCAIWEALLRNHQESHMLHVTAQRQDGLPPILSVAHTPSTLVQDPGTTAVTVSSEPSDSLKLVPGTRCQLQLSDYELNQKVFLFRPPSFSTELPSCSGVFSRAERSLRMLRDESNILVYFPNPTPGSLGQKRHGLSIIFTNVQCSAPASHFGLSSAINIPIFLWFFIRSHSF